MNRSPGRSRNASTEGGGGRETSRQRDRFLEDGVAIFAVWESANIRVTMWNFRSPFRGKYRFRISAYGYQSQGKPVKFHVTGRHVQGGHRGALAGLLFGALWTSPR